MFRALFSRERTTAMQQRLCILLDGSPGLRAVPLI